MNPYLSLPKPGPVLKGLLILIAAVGVTIAFAVHWISGGDALFDALVFTPQDFLRGQVWRLWTAALVTHPSSLSHLLFTLLGLYLLLPDLEQRWSRPRFIAFLSLTAACGFLLSIPFAGARPLFGAGAIVAATAVAWGREHARRQVRLFLILPATGIQLAWLTLALTSLAWIYPVDLPEGGVAPLVGSVAGWISSGSPTPLRSLVLQLKLYLLRRKKRSSAIWPPSSSSKAPSSRLRILQNDSRRKQTQDDKRHLN